MKKLTMSSLLAVSSMLAMAGFSQVNAAPSHPTEMNTQAMQDHGHHHRDGRRGGMRGALEQLNLTEAQKDQLKALKEANRNDREANRNLSKEERQAKHAQMRNAIDNILTAEQRAQLEKMRAEHQARRPANPAS